MIAWLDGIEDDLSALDASAAPDRVGDVWEFERDGAPRRVVRVEREDGYVRIAFGPEGLASPEWWRGQGLERRLTAAAARLLAVARAAEAVCVTSEAAQVAWAVLTTEAIARTGTDFEDAMDALRAALGGEL